jgi:hypothetical protein
VGIICPGLVSQYSSMYVFGRIPYSIPLSFMYSTWEYKPLTKAQAQQTNHLSEGKKGETQEDIASMRFSTSKSQLKICTPPIYETCLHNSISNRTAT